MEEINVEIWRLSIHDLTHNLWTRASAKRIMDDFDESKLMAWRIKPNLTITYSYTRLYSSYFSGCQKVRFTLLCRPLRYLNYKMKFAFPSFPLLISPMLARCDATQ